MVNLQLLIGMTTIIDPHQFELHLTNLTNLLNDLRENLIGSGLISNFLQLKHHL